MRKHIFSWYILGALLLVSIKASSQIKIVSGFETEIYNQFAQDIKNNTDVPMLIYSTKGSIDNFNRLLSDSIQIAFMQHDVLLYKSLEFPDIKDYIKMFLPLYYEEIHLITKNNSKINSISDLKGKIVGIGSKNAGSNITANFIKLRTEIDWIDSEIPFDNSFQALLSDSIDAFFFVGAAPANALKSLSKELSNIIKLIPIQDKRLDDIYTKKTIESGTYAWVDDDIKTYTVRSLLVVNTKNIDESMDADIKLLYNDLKENIKGIRKNKLSHPKWEQVDFSDRKHIDWPVYKKEYVSVRLVTNLLAIIAAIMTFIQIYFMLNKLWSRKHERVVAESISISAMFISIVINSLFVFKNIIDGGYPQMAANLMWITGSIMTTMIGVGFWVAGSRRKGFFVLLKQALKLEREEATDLAKAFFKPSGADIIIDILGQVAMIDDDLDPKEIEFIETFAEVWGIKIDWDYVRDNFGSKNGVGFHELRESMTDYLVTSPPENQVSQLGDVIKMLVNADDQVTREEELILDELTGIIADYLSGESDSPVYKVAVVPQNSEQETAIETIIKDLHKTEIAGGYAYLSEPFYSERYAEIVCEKYRSLNIFTVVIQPENIQHSHEIINQKLKKDEE
ncbi:MAG: TAXI family TRAP transporter solute-binding subunit [Saprospiraceae bacterium]|nr:TAXI family TRAP transporter solute-binding subunit [Saprospiraceae bacterium]